MVDIDLFSDYNDQLGHCQGDRRLQSLAALIRQSLRRPGDFLARYGGEEFLVVLPDTERKGSLNVAESILYDIRILKLKHPGNQVEPVVTVSIGVATALPKDVVEPSALIKASENALFLAKSKGGHQIKELPV